MSLIGPLFALIACLGGAVLGMQTYAAFGSDTALSIGIGSASIVAMSLAMMLAARPRLAEPFFGGLDRMYVVHKWLGVAALALMVGHDLMEPDLEDWARETGLGELAEGLGEVAFYGFIGLILVSLVKRLPFTRLELPWPLWRFSHRFMAVFFALAVLHQMFIDKPAGIDPTLTQYLNAFSVAGLVAWGYTEFLAPLLRWRRFTLGDITSHGSITALTLAPAGRAMRWRPGQFVFVRSPEAGLAEAHPFTIASAPRPDGSLRLGVKRLGDWTGRLPERLRPGATVLVEGPYGRFNFRRGRKHQVWLAGGIGITPFLAWAESLTAAEQRSIVLVWSVATREEAFALDTLQAAAARTPNFRFHVTVTAENGRLDADRLAGLVLFPIRQADLFYCGPAGLKDGILAGLKDRGQSPRRVRFEVFELR